MRRAFGAVLISVGLVPVAMFVGFVIWLNHMHTVGLSSDMPGKALLALLVAADIACLVTGFRLVKRPRGTRSDSAR